jgi:hypothetical protein
MTANELAQKCKEVAQKHKTLYVMGCIGSPMNATNKERYTANHSYNRQTTRTVKIRSATSDTFGFDCVCLIKSLLWGFNGDKTKTYGGAVYTSNGVPDIDANAMIKACSDVSTDFSKIEVGEVVWMTNHIGVYIGNGLAVECTPIWKDGVQITAVHNIGKKTGYNGRTWTKHGKLPYVTYAETNGETTVNVELTMLKQGANGEQVKTLQRLLIALDYDLGSWGADGDFGAKTEEAVKAFQRAKNIGADGVVGAVTWGRLLKG